MAARDRAACDVEECARGKRPSSFAHDGGRLWRNISSRSRPGQFMRSMSSAYGFGGVLAGAHVCAKQRGAVEGDAAIHVAVGDPLHDCNGLVELLPTQAKDPKEVQRLITKCDRAKKAPLHCAATGDFDTVVHTPVSASEDKEIYLKKCDNQRHDIKRYDRSCADMSRAMVPWCQFRTLWRCSSDGRSSTWYRHHCVRCEPGESAED